MGARLGGRSLIGMTLRPDSGMRVRSCVSSGSRSCQGPSRVYLNPVMVPGDKEGRPAADDREADLDGREAGLELREADLAERRGAAEQILAAADQRDAITDARDEKADERSNDLDRAEFMDRDSNYGEHWPERRNAARDREHAKDDRAASRDDRVALTEDDDVPDAGGT